MLKIGEFSKLGQVTVPTLRYYDEIGLLRPLSIDPFSGYRSYSVAQLPRLNRILALKHLGFTLEEIAPLLDETRLSERIRNSFRAKQAAITERLAAEQELLSRVEARLRLIEGEERMAEYDIVLKSVAPHTVASIREVVPTFRDAQFLLPRLSGWIKSSRAVPSGRPFMIWHLDEYREADIDAEFCLPISGKAAVSGGVCIHRMAGISSVASTLQKGVREFDQASQAIAAWIEQNGYQIAGHSRHVYLEPDLLNPPADFRPENIISEVQIPIERPA
ncbi:MAG TPA: MerR family transcriptional regulator [Capsulimonadaceae bacterium]|nr:MerR family transcriptional regulator [Capsulimonadaceae bacterium]